MVLYAKEVPLELSANGIVKCSLIPEKKLHLSGGEPNRDVVVIDRAFAGSGHIL